MRIKRTLPPRQTTKDPTRKTARPGGRRYAKSAGEAARMKVSTERNGGRTFDEETGKESHKCENGGRAQRVRGATNIRVSPWRSAHHRPLFAVRPLHGRRVAKEWDRGEQRRQDYGLRKESVLASANSRARTTGPLCIKRLPREKTELTGSRHRSQKAGNYHRAHQTNMKMFIPREVHQLSGEREGCYQEDAGD